MMKRKFWAVALSLVAVLCLAFALTACGGNKTECEKNGHSFTTEWTSDTTDHWHKCANCDEISDKAAHVYDNDADTICNICGYERAVVPSVNTYTISFFTSPCRPTIFATWWIRCNTVGDSNDSKLTMIHTRGN